MNWSWTCDAGTGVCTLSGDMQAYLTDVLQALWTLAGLLLASILVGGVVALFLSRVRG